MTAAQEQERQDTEKEGQGQVRHGQVQEENETRPATRVRWTALDVGSETAGWENESEKYGGKGETLVSPGSWCAEKVRGVFQMRGRVGFRV